MTRRGRGHLWRDIDDARLAELYPDTPTAEIARRLGRSISAIYGRADKLGLRKSAAYLASPQACRLRRGDNVGQSHRFLPGHVPANKGKRGLPSVGRMAETQFKKGSRSGRAEALYQPIGAERISKDGYLQRKINDDMPLQRRWRGVHILLWEAAHGPLPAGHAIAFKDGDKTHIALDNLELVSRADMLRRNSVHRLPKEVVALVRLRSVLIRKLNRAQRDQQEAA